MNTFTKKQVWAALLTAAAIFSLTGCDAFDFGKTDYTEATMGVIESVEEYTSNTDYLYTKNDDGTIAISGYSGKNSIITVPDTLDGLKVTAIGDHAFEANWDLEEVIIPEGITYIGESAFMDCGVMKSVVIPETVVTIRRAAFANCSSLDNVVIPAGVAEIMEETFSGCGNLKSLTVASTSVVYESWGLDKTVMPELVITCPDGSQISKWAKENGFGSAGL